MTSLFRFHRSGAWLAASLIGSILWAGCDSSASLQTDRKDAAQKQPGSESSHAGHVAGGPAPEANPTPRIPAYFANLEAARPLRAVLDPNQFTSPVVVKAYQYAKELPEIFAQQPCYCYCDASEEHKSLLDCYATTHSVG